MELLNTLTNSIVKLAEDFSQESDKSYVVSQMIDGIAKAIFASAWADSEEEKGTSFSGKDIMNVMPKVPVEAKFKAKEIASAIEQSNHKSLYDIYQQASEADGADADPSELGHYLGMQSLGHGVSWFDDHADFPLHVPLTEFYWDGPYMN